MNCPFCNADIEDDLQQCPHCGGTISRERVNPLEAMTTSLGPNVDKDVPGAIRCARAMLLALGLLASVAVVFWTYAVVRAFIALENVAPEQQTRLGATVVAALALTLLLAYLALLPFSARKALNNGLKTRAIVAAVLSLVLLPVGTAMGILILIALADADSKNWLLWRSGVRLIR